MCEINYENICRRSYKLPLMVLKKNEVQEWVEKMIILNDNINHLMATLAAAVSDKEDPESFVKRFIVFETREEFVLYKYTNPWNEFVLYDVKTHKQHKIHITMTNLIHDKVVIAYNNGFTQTLRYYNKVDEDNIQFVREETVELI